MKNDLLYDIKDAARVRVLYTCEEGTLQLSDEDSEYIFMHISLAGRFEDKVWGVYRYYDYHNNKGEKI